MIFVNLLVEITLCVLLADLLKVMKIYCFSLFRLECLHVRVSLPMGPRTLGNCLWS
jgi:hypothetical protein